MNIFHTFRIALATTLLLATPMIAHSDDSESSPSLTEKAAGLFNASKKLVKESADTVATKSAQAWEATKSTTNKAVDATAEGVSKATDTTADASKSAWDATKSTTTKAVDVTKSGTAKAVDVTVDASKKAWDATKDVTKNAVDYVSDKLKKPAQTDGATAVVVEKNAN